LLKSIEIKRFKSLVSQKVEFGRVNLFVGGNGAGKSNLLEALGLVSAGLSRGVTDSDLVAKGVRLSAPAMFKSAFKNRGLPSTFRIETTFSNRVTFDFDMMASGTTSHLRFKAERAAINSRTVFGRSGNGATVLGQPLAARPIVTRGMYDQLRSLAGFNNLVTGEFDAFSQYAIYSPQTEFLRGTDVGTAQQPPVGLHGEGLPLATATLLNYWRSSSGDLRRRLDSIFSIIWSTGWTNQFGVGSPGVELMSPQVRTGEQTVYFRDHFMHLKRNRVTAYDASEGVLFLLFLVIMLAHPESPHAFALDNVDSALNPRMTQYAVAKLVEFTKATDTMPGKQVFMTSHNPTAMDAIDLFDHETRIFTISRSSEGHSVVKRIEPPPNLTRDEWMVKKGGRSMSELWLSGDIPGALGEAML
jgi:hypothetical protein